jgi:hypothetical protein
MRGFCPGLDSFHPEIQYLISSGCQKCVVKSNDSQNASFYIHFFTLSFVFESKISDPFEYLNQKQRLN